MNKQQEALKLALGELQAGKVGNAMQILREALAEQRSGIKQVIELYDSPEQPTQQHIEHCIWARCGNRPCPHVQPRREFVGLTDDERGQVYSDWRWNGGNSSNLELCRAIEAKLREKNA